MSIPELEPIAPDEAVELFIEHKQADCAFATVRNYRYRLQYFVQWCLDNGLENLNNLKGRDIQQFRLWRKEDADLKSTTMRNHLCSLRVFLKWAASIEAVPENLYDKIILPNVGHGERHREEMLEAEHAQELLDYLNRYHFASIEHATIALLYETGLRIGGANSLDVDDLFAEEEYLRLRHRPNSGTQLKNGEGGERLIAITPDLAHLLTEHIENVRFDVSDEHGRYPLLCTSNGRRARSSIRRLVYRVTAPCFRGEPCPDCNKGEEKKCPQAVSPHAIRRGAITRFLSEDVPVEIVGDRMNVSRDVLIEHYDQRSEEVKLEQRRGYLDNI